MGGNHTEATDQTAYSQVDHHGPLAVLGPKVEGNDKTGDNNDTCETEEARGNDPLLHILDRSYRRLGWGAESNNDGANDAVETADFAYEAKTLFEEYRREDSADDDGQSTHGGDQDSIGEGVRDQIAYLEDGLARARVGVRGGVA